MSTQTAFQRGVHPLLRLLLPGKEEAVLAAQPDRALRERIEQLAAKSTEGELAGDERDEYEGYVRVNKFVATLRREARTMKGQRRLVTEAARAFVRQRAANRCEYCRLHQDDSPLAALHLEHIRPRKHGGLG